MVERDHTRVDPTEAFLSESIRRDAMSGTRTVFALEMIENINRRITSSAPRTKTYIPGESGNDG